MTDVVEEFRATDVNGPLRVFVRQPIASQDWAENEFIRIVVWENMEAWADGVWCLPRTHERCDACSNHRIPAVHSTLSPGVEESTLPRLPSILQGCGTRSVFAVVVHQAK